MSATVEVDQKVDFTVDAFPTRTFHGEVVQVRNAPITVQNVVTYDTVIGVNNPDLKLKPGMTANVSIVVAQRDDVLKIQQRRAAFPAAGQRTPPPDAVVRRRTPGASRRERCVEPSARFMFCEVSKPSPVQIKTGISDGISTEVLEGLKEGDRVVTAMTGNAASVDASHRTIRLAVGRAGSSANRMMAGQRRRR